jgi:hypothetical protein
MLSFFCPKTPQGKELPWHLHAGCTYLSEQCRSTQTSALGLRRSTMSLCVLTLNCRAGEAAWTSPASCLAQGQGPVARASAWGHWWWLQDQGPHGVLDIQTVSLWGLLLLPSPSTVFQEQLVSSQSHRLTASGLFWPLRCSSSLSRLDTCGSFGDIRIQRLGMSLLPLLYSIPASSPLGTVKSVIILRSVNPLHFTGKHQYKLCPA